MRTDSCPPARRVKIYGKIIADQRYEPASWQGQLSRRFPAGFRIGRFANSADSIPQPRLRTCATRPVIELEALKGDRAGQMSIRINDQWRICFRWSKGDADDVEIADYHS